MLTRTIGLALAAILVCGSLLYAEGHDDEVTLVPPGHNAKIEKIVKVVALPRDGIILDGKPATLESLRKILAPARGTIVVWYHRDPNQPQTANQREVVSIIIANKAPVSMSSKPDFSDYVDDRGQTHPRRSRPRN
jgi:hypothetical protein